MTDYLLRKNELPGLTRRFALALLGMLGWRVRYRPLPGPRGVIVVYPHTSNWDFPIGILAKLAIGMPFHFIAKSSLFEGLTGASIGRVVRYLGGEPVERGVSTGAIARLAEKMHAADWYWMAIAPEGSRSLKPYWRSGFYHIAMTAKVPLGCAYFDFVKKEVALVDYLDLTGNREQDMASIRAVFEGVQGCRPGFASPVALRPDEDKAG
ncbi:1-acyl-sn-glycerol-3-phosphate acyltransferase [Undibacterium sp. CY18W]|uniref:1-acyl-sn-glycerol-3-phosphate acyltransferase n=1 Tax=Undibacterium hunanense TaxID=2762292 RepID=A0ABR6ZYH4_9BURK|nr:1-acyl-sn-glycerol-3-phosphate acyltransferase [Undibacterium hunanense]MBC3920699.1 1-acyl-sn-glycerol-3-phosphate acyltransferase [Undibacterium hunanense]